MEPTNIREYRKARKKTKKYKLPTYFIYFLLVIVGIYFFLHSAFFNIKNIEIMGNINLEEAKILDLCQINSEQNLIFLNNQKIVESILVNPLAKNVELAKKLPNTLKITITERVPVALLVCPDGFIQVSEDGYFLALLKNIGHYAIPIINGISMDYLPGPGQKIKNDTLLTVLEIIKQSDPNTLKYIAEINMANSSNILAYTTLGVEIKLGDLERLEEKLYNLDLILLELINKTIESESIEYIDLRFAGPPIVKKKI